MFLYIVSTPIGNLRDLTLRALDVLKSVDLILCEDTRVTSKLLQKYDIKKPLLSYHQHSKINQIDKILKLLEERKNLALVSDAGTPGISDPGNLLVQKALEKFGDNIKIVPIPGVSALVTLASISGINMDKFLFLGFLPAKKNRSKILKEIKNSEYPVIFYESRYKIIKTLNDLQNIVPGIQVVIGRELTKIFETIYRGSIDRVLEKIKNDPQKGEYVVMIHK
jgi:16S rRNA (cytidine1402-2'-O)-methyltransferase